MLGLVAGAASGLRFGVPLLERGARSASMTAGSRSTRSRTRRAQAGNLGGQLAAAHALQALALLLRLLPLGPLAGLPLGLFAALPLGLQVDDLGAGVGHGAGQLRRASASSARACRNSITLARPWPRHWLGNCLRSGSRPVPRSAWLRMSMRCSTPARSRCALHMASQRPRSSFSSAARSALVKVWPALGP
jgi:hypothetical protein